MILALALTMATVAAANPPRVLNAAELKQHLAKFARVDLTVDVSKLPESEQRVLARLVEAARIFDPLFMRQSWSGNEELLTLLAADSSPLARLQLETVLLNKGPWSRLEPTDHLVPGVPEKPEPGAFYPPGATREQIDAWLKSLPPAERAKAGGYFTNIRRSPDGHFVAVPYSIEFQSDLGDAARLLREAAQLTMQPTLKAFLAARADAFLSNDYYASDVAWMQLDASVEPTLGPYEVYEDGWFNAKAAFEAFITVRDEAESQKLARFSSELQDIENHLPIDAALRNPKLGALAPIRVVNSIFCSGDANRGVQTAAYNLPNDERVTAEKGTKRVMLRNVQEAKFNQVLLPIARVALTRADQKNVAFDSFFTHILMHELMHGLGPHNLTLNGRATTVRAELQALYSAIEEAKADVSGLWALQYLVDKGVLDKAMEKTMYTTYLASAFRSIRFGLTEAHGRGVALQLNYLLDRGGFRVNADGTFSVDGAKIRSAVESLAHDLLMLEAHGDKAGAKQLLDTLALNRPETQKVLARLGKVPVDIAPRFTTAEKLVAQFGENASRAP